MCFCETSSSIFEMRRRQKLIALFALSLTILIYFFHFLQRPESSRNVLQEVSSRDEKFKKALKTETKAFDQKTVLFWNEFFTYKFWLLPEEAFKEGFLAKTGCPFTNCMFTLDRSFLHRVHDYDAILFHTAQPTPGFRDIPKTRTPNQVYIMASKE